MRNIRLISASAGSGKTYSLTKQVLDAVASGVEPERIMAVTFTNKAAAELKERIYQRLVEQQGERGEQMRQKAGSLADAYIGTINSICARLLKEFAFEAGESPAVDIMPEQETKRLFRLAVSHVIGKYYNKLSGAARRLERDGSGSGYAQKPDWREDVRGMVDLARANGLDQVALTDQVQGSLAGLKKHLGKETKSLSDKRLIELVEQAISDIQTVEDTTKTTASTLLGLRSILHALKGGYATWSSKCGLANITAGTRSGANTCLDSLRDYAGKLQHHPALHRDIETLISGVFSCASEALISFEAYKRINGLMDFADQESKVLQLLDIEAVSQRLAERIDLVLVDEFQDTSPIQLAMFSKLSALVKANVWVGDQKQAIYGFRGADPVLMDKVIAQLKDDQIGVLGDSYRSRPDLVSFANEVFVQAFEGLIPEDRVRLNAMRKDGPTQSDALGMWLLTGSRKTQRSAALAQGIAGVLRAPDKWKIVDRENEELRAIRAGDIAVLCRSNDACREISEVLGGYGIRASVGRGALFAQPECIVALASLRLLTDPKDTLALAELVQCLPDHASASTWLGELTRDTPAALMAWSKDARIEALLKIREDVVDQSPLELFEMAADIMGLESHAFGHPNPAQDLSNIKALGQFIGEYQDACKARHEAATLPGLLYWIGLQDDPGKPEGRDDQTVQVLTYHRSKGLEWPFVILHDLDSKGRFSPFGIAATQADQFDPDQPLADRGLRYWPEPFNGNGLPFGDSIGASPEYAAAESREDAERQRLMYVGMTRARDYLILGVPYFSRSKTADPFKQCGWLEDLIPGDLAISLPDLTDETHQIGIGKETFTCHVSICQEEDEPTPVNSQNLDWFVPGKVEGISYNPYRVAASSWHLSEDQQSKVNSDLVNVIGEPIAIRAGAESSALGEAIHRFLAADRLGTELKARQAMAERLLGVWGVSDYLPVDSLISVSDAFHQWVAGTWIGGKLHKECPVKLRMGRQVMHGWIDALIETDAGFIIVDHKSFPGDEEESLRRAKEYAGQLELYRQAVAEATQKPVIQMLIHFALQGRIVQVGWDD